MTFFNWLKLRGDTDDTVIGNVGDKLKISGSFSQSPIPNVLVQYKDDLLRDAGDPDMNVNGATTNVNYDYAPPTGEVWYVEYCTILIDDAGSSDGRDFGSIQNGLSNGVYLNIKSDGNAEYTEVIVKDNYDIVQCFVGGATGSSQGFLDSSNAFYGKMPFYIPIKLDGTKGDYIRGVVKDNLTGLVAFRLAIHFFKEQL